jgi:hypothetical protein
MSIYRDSTSYVSGSGIADDYTTLQNYRITGNSKAAPLNSVLKLSVAPGSTKYFSVAPIFQSRLDNFRIPPPAMTPIALTDSNVPKRKLQAARRSGGSRGTGRSPQRGTGRSPQRGTGRSPQRATRGSRSPNRSSPTSRTRSARSPQRTSMRSAEGARGPSSGEYARLGQTYKLNAF